MTKAGLGIFVIFMVLSLILGAKHPDGHTLDGRALYTRT